MSSLTAGFGEFASGITEERFDKAVQCNRDGCAVHDAKGVTSAEQWYPHPPRRLGHERKRHASTRSACRG